jgi:hypothetical protein
MADYTAIAAVGLSLERLLRYWFEIEDPVPVLGSTTRVVLISTDDLLTANFDTRIGRPALSIFLHRIEVNRVMRAAWSGAGSQTGRATIPVDLHFLLTAWGENAEYEQRILGRAMQCLEAHPTLSGPMLHESGRWSPQESVQVTVDDIPLEAVMRTFDSLPVDYRLTMPYVARLARIETPEPLAGPVTTARLGATASATP